MFGLRTSGLKAPLFKTLESLCLGPFGLRVQGVGLGPRV